MDAHELKDAIAKRLYVFDGGQPCNWDNHSHYAAKERFYKVAEQLMELCCQYIEGVENPYENKGHPIKHMHHFLLGGKRGFDEAIKTILNGLRPSGKPNNGASADEDYDWRNPADNPYILSKSELEEMENR